VIVLDRKFASTVRTVFKRKLLKGITEASYGGELKTY
jgi:hypothetical protein